MILCFHLSPNHSRCRRSGRRRRKKIKIHSKHCWPFFRCSRLQIIRSRKSVSKNCSTPAADTATVRVFSFISTRFSHLIYLTYVFIRSFIITIGHGAKKKTSTNHSLMLHQKNVYWKNLRLKHKVSIKKTPLAQYSSKRHFILFLRS